MSDRDNPRSLVEIMNDVLSTVREHYDSEYVYYIEKEYEDIDVIYEWCAKHVPWQRDKIKMLPKDQRPRWMEQEITDTTEDSYSVFRRLDENTVAILAAVGVHRGGCEVDLLRSVLAYLPEAITLQKLQKQQEYLSYHDKLTGLYNRNSFVSYTTDINPDELNSLGAVSVDINGLKNFNKEFGRDYGDEVVIRVGEVLEEYFHTANVYRMTGDEYLVLVENITYEEFMKQVHGTYTKLDNISLGLASLGCAWEKIDIDVDALVLSAENMMREEKKKYYKKGLVDIKKNKKIVSIINDIKKNGIKVMTIVMSLISSFFLTTNVYAVEKIEGGNVTIESLGAIIKSLATKVQIFGIVLSFIALVVFVIQFIIGDDETKQRRKKTILYTLGGVALLILVPSIINFVIDILG